MNIQNTPRIEISGGSPKQLGARFDGSGTNFAVFSANATQIDLCIFSQDGKTELTRTPFPERTGPVWHGHVPGLGAGTRHST